MTLAVITQAEDYQILSAAELRAAAGLAAGDESRDAELADLGLEAAEWVAALCGVGAADTGYGSPAAEPPPPTFWRETLLETVILPGTDYSLSLSRRFVSGVSLTLDDAAVAAADYSVIPSAGRLDRVAGAVPTFWANGIVAVTYDAGFVTMPPAIKGVVRDFVRLRLSQSGVDPMVRSETTQDLDSVSYFAATDGEGGFEQSARRRLSRFLLVPI